MVDFSAADLEKLRSPHVARAWFGEFNLPSGVRRLHSGTERVSVGGQTWEGVADPVSGQMVSISQVQDPRFGEAASVQITIASPTVSFFKSVKDDARTIEGRGADIYWAAFDQETFEVLMFKRLFPGQMSAPELIREFGVRKFRIVVESQWHAFGFSFGGKWNHSDQQRRYSGDLGMEFVGVEISENWT